MRFCRALDRGNVTEALPAASELQFVSLAEALDSRHFSLTKSRTSSGAPPVAGPLGSCKKCLTST
jgi:hypothetical protein